MKPMREGFFALLMGNDAPPGIATPVVVVPLAGATYFGVTFDGHTVFSRAKDSHHAIELAITYRGIERMAQESYSQILRRYADENLPPNSVLLKGIYEITQFRVAPSGTTTEG